MPAVYAHYRMGAELLPSLPGDVRRTIQRFRRLFDAGLHGPDIFLYYNPFLPSKIGTMGSKFHAQTGREFFQRVCRVARLEKSEAMHSYIYGVLCHYALDSVCHPFINEQASRGAVTHGQIEAEFDRFLLETDGKVPPESQDLSPHLRLTPGECATIAKFYPPVTSRQVEDSLRNMAHQVKMFATPEGARRTLLRKSMDLLKLPIGHMMMTTGANPQCAHLNAPLKEKYDLAVVQFPELLSQLQGHLTYNGGLGEEFKKIFG